MRQYNIASIYKQAPDLLLDKLAEVNANLSVQDHKTKAYKFWKGVADVMKFAYGYMNDFHYVIKENELLKGENEFLKHWAADLSNRLQTYESIKAEKLSGTFEETVKRVDNHLSNE